MKTAKSNEELVGVYEVMDATSWHPNCQACRQQIEQEKAQNIIRNIEEKFALDAGRDTDSGGGVSNLVIRAGSDEWRQFKSDLDIVVHDSLMEDKCER